MALAVAAGLAGGAISSLADYASTVNGLKPVAYYRFSETNAVAADIATNNGSLGAAFNGEYQAMQKTHGAAGALVGDANTAVSIDGAAGQQVVVPFSKDYNPSGPFTVEFWAKPAAGSSASGNRTAAISMINGQNAGNVDDRSGWCIRHNAATWQFVLGFDHSDGATYYHTILGADGSVVEDAWQHVVAVYTPTAVSLYINGALAATDAPAKPVMPNHAAPLILGDRGYTGWDFNGGLDEFAIYTVALTEAEIKSHYDNGLSASRTKPYQTLILEKNPALYFRLGEPAPFVPVAKNNGSAGAAADADYLSGTMPGVAGPQSPSVNGFESTNRAVSLNGGYVKAPALQNMVVTEATFACWIKLNGAQPNRAGIMHQRVPGTATGATGLGFQDGGVGISYNWNDDGKAYTFNPGFVPPDKTWTFIAVSVMPDQAVMYMGTASGLAAATNTITHTEHDFSIGPLDIGIDPYEAVRLFKGEIDEFTFFDRALTKAEVQSMYNAALPAILGIARTPADPVYEGMNVNFQGSVSVSGAVIYQWRKNGTNLLGKTSASLALSSVKASDSGSYDLLVTAGAVNLVSLPSSLAVSASAPILKTSPVSAVRFLNGKAEFSCSVIGSQPISYQWKHETNVIAGATNATLTLSDLQAADAGGYTVTISNPLGSVNATAVLFLTTPSKYAAAALNAGPLGYWRLDETTGSVAYDYWGGRDGTFATGVTNGAVGPQPAAQAGFDASNQAYGFASGVVTVPPLNLNQATMTIVAWIKPDGTQPSYAGLVFSRGSGTVSGLDFQNNGQLGYHWNDAADTYNFSSGLIPTDAQWNFVALVVEPAQGTIYLDDGSGIVSAVNAVSHSASGFAANLVFGNDPAGGRQYRGLMDEVAIYDRALSETEITALRNAGFKGTYTAKPVTFVQQPVSQTIMVGNRYALEAKVAGSVPISYQWQKNGQDLAGAIRSSLVFDSAVEADSGAYQLVVTQGANKVSSSTATLLVKPVPAYLNATDGLVLHLTFDSDYKDSSGRKNDGTPVGSPSLVPGKIGPQALHYNTDKDAKVYNYVTLGTPSDLQFGATVNFSVAFWIKFTGAPGDLPFLANNSNSMGDSGVTIAPSYNEGGWSWGLNDSVEKKAWPGIGLYDPVKRTLNDGQWHHLLHLFDRQGDGTTYLDGKKVHSMSITSAAGWDLNTGSPWDIGQAGGTYAETGTFEMDDLGVWRRVLNMYEAQALYIVGKNYGRSFDTVGPAEVRLQIAKTANGVEITWPQGALEASDTVNGGFSAVAGAASPYKVEPAAGLKFYRIKVQ